MKDVRDNAKTEKKQNNEEKKPTLGVENDLRVVISSKADGILFDQICCTCINIILNDDGEIATSFMGIHNENIIKELEHAQKAYFKAIKKTLKEERRSAKAKIDAEKANEGKHNKNKENKDPDTKKSDIVATDTPSVNHECDKSGKCLAKKKIDKKTVSKSKK